MNHADADAAKADSEACGEGGSEWINIIQHDPSMFLKRTTDNGRVTAKMFQQICSKIRFK